MTNLREPLSRPLADARGHPLPPPRGPAEPRTSGQGERVTREAILAAARGWIGTPYRHQAALKGVGCDCLGLIVGVFAEVTGRAPETLPPYTPDWAEAAGRETLAEGLRRHLCEIAPAEAAAGDVVLFRWKPHLPAKHAAILTGPGRMIHAQEGAAVAEVAMGAWWGRRLAFAFSVRAAYVRSLTCPAQGTKVEEAHSPTEAVAHSSPPNGGEKL